ncbi:zinc transporter ZIP1-like isoform X2 [Convolutriloba macropyga]|uniref:zinc transporter ZIP1-like isoform X2 n=1 Tax=Convolutriloba macropyga TaxID=536237 RepID=UPI003F5226FC
MNATGAKVICLFGLLADCLLFGFIPRIIIPPKRQPGQPYREYIRDTRKFYHVSKKNRKLFVSLAGTFGGGVFLATCLLDLLVDVTEDFEEFFEQAGLDIDFPFAEFTACVGFFLILFLEQLVLYIKELSLPPRTPSLDSISRSSSVMQGSVNDNGATGGNDSMDIDRMEDTRTSSGRRNSTLGSVRGIKQQQNNEHENHQFTVTDTMGDEQEESLEPSKIRAAILLLALSVHSVFEGLAVGLEGTASKVFQLFGALIVHKSVLAFSLGMSVVQSNMSLKETFFSVLGFAAASPIGIAIGIIVSQEQGLFVLGLSTVLQGLATGTFLYITFFEVLPLEFNCSRWRMQKVASLLLGFGVMCFMIIYAGD